MCRSEISNMPWDGDRGGAGGVIEKQGKMKLRWFALNIICVLGVTGEKKKCFHLMLCLKKLQTWN